MLFLSKGKVAVQVNSCVYNFCIQIQQYFFARNQPKSNISMFKTTFLTNSSNAIVSCFLWKMEIKMAQVSRDEKSVASSLNFSF
jgi:hypothetical protein